MATQRRSPKSTAKKSSAKPASTARKRTSLKASPDRRKRSMTTTARPSVSTASKGEGTSSRSNGARA
ncbi:MAG: hypothetical protein ABIQ95_10465, partial [Bdellovibrionia bacterium]